MDEFEKTGELRKVFSGEIDLSHENKKSTLMVDEEDILKMADAIRQNRVEDQIFAINLDRFLENGARSSEYIYVCKTSNALAISGADKELDVVIAPRTIAKCMADPEIKYHGHGLTKDILQRIPEELRNPVMIFQGNKDSSLVVITRLKDNKSRGVMVAVNLSETGKRNEVNRISSIYGRNNFINYLKAQLQNENLIAVNKKEAKIMLQSAGLQLPLEETYLNFNDSIAYTMQNVKGFKEKINEGRKKNMNVFVQNLGKYNEGVIQGGWITFPAPEKSVDDFLKKEVGLNEQNEEYMIADIETNLSCYRFNETENLYDLNLLAAYENVAADIEMVNTYCEEFGISEPLEICNVIAQEDDLACQSIPISERIKEISLSDDEKLGYTLAHTQDLENLFEEKGLGDYYMYVDLEAYGRDARINNHYIVKDDYIVSFNSSDVKTDLFSREELVDSLNEDIKMDNGIHLKNNISHEIDAKKQQPKQSMKDKLAAEKEFVPAQICNLDRFFIETNSCYMVALVDVNAKAFVIHESYNKEKTMDMAKNADYKKFDECKTAEDCARVMEMSEKRIVDFKDLISCAERFIVFYKKATGYDSYIKDNLLGWINEKTTESDQAELAENNRVHNGRK